VKQVQVICGAAHDRIQRVLENLVTNAREALAVWGREKKIAIRARAEGGAAFMSCSPGFGGGGGAGGVAPSNFQSFRYP
jgi:C4-dicarboxylate-specific signal transduction histidine kinase